MKIGVVVHGPGIIDSGWALEVINLLSNIGEVKCRLGGTMGRTAVIDASLESVINISTKLLPSESLELFNRDKMDVIFLLNYGKSSETGHTFGYNVFNRYFKKIANEDFLATNYKPLYDSKIPVIQIERPGEEDGSIINWNLNLNDENDSKNKSDDSVSEDPSSDSEPVDVEKLTNELSRILSLNIVNPEDIYNKYFSENILKSDESVIAEELALFNESEDLDNYVSRKVHGVSPGENIMINSVVVGKATSNLLILLAKDGELVDIIGGKIKDHGVEKLGKINLDKAIIKTGLLRKMENITPRVLNSDSISTEDSDHFISTNLNEDLENKTFKVAYLDHAAYDVYKFKDMDLVITVGDDTTLIASDILYRFDIPIIGIVDGDLDKVVESGFVHKDSVKFEVDAGFDDVIGNKISEGLFLGKSLLEFPLIGDVEFSDFKTSKIGEIKNIIINLIGDLDLNYNILDN